MRILFSSVLYSCAYACLFGSYALAIDTPITKETNQPASPSLSSEEVQSSHSISINGVTIPYTATAGKLTLQDEKDQAKAHIFYVAYTKSSDQNLSERPITFCFNGGPGSSSVWLHMGAFGPQTVMCNDRGLPVIPYSTKVNESSLLDLTDLVFIDPVATGLSTATTGQDPKEFFTLDSDIESIAEFIRLYVTKNGRWRSPKLLAGESYGTTRAAGLASYLQDNLFMSLDGILLISSVLDWQTLSLSSRYSGNDLACALSLPSFAAAAWFHKKANTKLSLDQFLSEVNIFATTEYTLALMQGCKIDPTKKEQIIQKLMGYTGLSKEFIERCDMRFNVSSFSKELLRSSSELIGRFDARIKGYDLIPCSGTASYDPSIEQLMLAYTSLFNDYLKTELAFKTDREYKILVDVFPWDFKHGSNLHLNLALDLHDTMTQNPSLQVFVASGLFDLATPYLATEYTIEHMQLNPALQKNVVSKFYPGGHMMYLDQANLKALKVDLNSFYKQLRQTPK
ncbi:MAG: peptidase S10 [Chlamydiae bacterium]|nr:peptidase S10 [Chlamydiota bacterium]